MKNTILVLCGLIFFCMRENAEPKLLSPAELKQDVFELRRGLEKYHPGLYWYTSKDQFDSAWDILSASINKSMSDDQFLKLLLPVVAKVETHNFSSFIILTNSV